MRARRVACCPRSRSNVSLAVVLATVLAIAWQLGVVQSVSAATVNPFSFLMPGYVQSLYGIGISSTFFGGVTFAPNGDLWVADCEGSGSLHRFSFGSTYSQDGNTLHTETTVSSDAGCGLAGGSNGVMYSNTFAGVAQINSNTGVPISTVGPAGDALGITIDPLTGNVVYVGSDGGTIYSLNPSNGISTTLFGGAPPGSLIDGIAFDPSGDYLFASDWGLSEVLVLNRSGALVQTLSVTGPPDGIAFHVNPAFVVTNNNNGTIDQFTFPNNDFTQTPVITTFASGGYRGDLTEVGADGCVYVTQDGTNFADGTTSSDNSIVQICPGFAPSSGVVGSPPTVASVQPSQGPLAGGTPVIISGTGFSTVPGGTTFDFGPDNPATDVSCSTTTACTAISPPGTATGTVDVLASVGGFVSRASVGEDNFFYEPPPPSIVSFSASPTVVSNSGGPVTLSASALNATKCVLQSDPPVVGLPVSISCSAATSIATTVQLPRISPTLNAQYTFTLTADGVAGTTPAQAQVQVDQPSLVPQPLTQTLTVSGYQATPTYLSENWRITVALPCADTSKPCPTVSYPQPGGIQQNPIEGLPFVICVDVSNSGTIPVSPPQSLIRGAASPQADPSGAKPFIASSLLGWTQGSGSTCTSTPDPQKKPSAPIPPGMSGTLVYIATAQFADFAGLSALQEVGADAASQAGQSILDLADSTDFVPEGSVPGAGSLIDVGTGVAKTLSERFILGANFYLELPSDVHPVYNSLSGDQGTYGCGPYCPAPPSDDPLSIWVFTQPQQLDLTGIYIGWSFAEDINGPLAGPLTLVDPYVQDQLTQAAECLFPTAVVSEYLCAPNEGTLSDQWFENELNAQITEPAATELEDGSVALSGSLTDGGATISSAQCSSAYIVQASTSVLTSPPVVETPLTLNADGTLSGGVSLPRSDKSGIYEAVIQVPGQGCTNGSPQIVAIGSVTFSYSSGRGANEVLF